MQLQVALLLIQIRCWLSLANLHATSAVSAAVVSALPAGAMLSATWAAHCGVMCRGVNWQRFDQATLLDICDCVGGLGLAAVLRLMAEDLSGAAGRFVPYTRDSCAAQVAHSIKAVN